MTSPSDPAGLPPPLGEPPQTARAGAGGEAPRRSPLTSPRLTAVLAIVLVALLAIAILPGLRLPRVVLLFGEETTPPATATLVPSSTPESSPTFSRPTPTPAPTFISYLVKPGDSLGSIANIYRTTARSIAWWNRGSYPTLDPESPQYAPSVIQVGWTLVLIPGVVVDDEHPPSPSPGRATPSATTPSGASPASAVPSAAGSPQPASR